MARRQRGSRQLSTRGVAPVFTESELAFLDDATDSDASHSSKSECAGGIPHDAADLIACRQYATVFVLATMGIFLMLLTPLVAQFPMFGLLLLPFTLFVHDWIVLHSSKLTRRFIPIINVKSMLAASSAQNPAFHEFFANSSFENRVYNCCLYGPEINPDIPRTADEISACF
ncbi:hypothetical protein L596_011959 [Steinernema carpocapsae]|uniref:Uncharacterized protein n=1 Tax=Steinernema carpocapsae TaxID=34508 RepID=A0A4V6A4N6_STECR|nr:hypothetical protein L596_011959 [Steinernema carpocapsae]